MKNLYIALLFAILAITGYAQNSWTGLAGPSGGKVSDIQNDGTKIFALATDLKAIYLSTDDGATWTQRSPAGTTISAMVVDATLHKLYAIESTNSNTSYVNVSSNDGLTWQRQNSTSALQAVKFLRLPTGELVAWGVSTNEGLSISFDNGITWTKFYTDAAYNTIFNVASNSVGDVFLSTSLGVFRHAHAVQGSWQASSFVNVRPAPAINSPTIRIGVDKSNDRLYVMEYYWNGTANVSGVYGSINNGTNWIDIKSDLPAGDMYYSEWFISANGVFLGVGNYNQKIYKVNTTLGGSWTEFTTSPGVAYSNSLVTAFTFISTKIFAGTTLDGIFKSTNNGSTWSIATKGINGFDGKDIEITSTGRILYLATSGLGFWYSDDQGVNWNFKQISSSNTSTEIVVVGTTLLAYGNNSLYKSTDNGNNWTGPVNGNFLGFVARGGTNELYATIYNVVSKSIDMGDTWTPLSITGLPSNFDFQNIATGQFTILFNQTIAIDGTGKLYLSLKNTNTNKFELYSVSSAGGAATKLPVEYSASYQVNETPNNLFAVGNKIYWSNNTGIFISIDNGATWTKRTFSNVKVMPVSSGIGASRNGVFFTSGDDGLTWNSYAIPNSASNSFVRSVATNTSNDAAFAATSLAPALKYVKPAPPFVNPLVVDPSTLPPYVNFNWTPFGGTSTGPAGGPYGGYIMKTFKGTKNPSKFFVLANYNLYSTPDMATPWTKVVDLNNNNISITDIAVDANGDFLAVGGGGFLKSTDEGLHWTGTWSLFNYSQSIRLTSTGILWVNDGINVRRSIDGGLTWSIIYSSAGHEGYNNNSMAAFGNTIFVTATGVGISRSTDANVAVPTFTTVNNGLPPLSTASYSVAVDPSGNAIAWYNGNIYRLTIGTDTWVPINNDLPLNTYFTYTFCKTDQEYYIFGPSGSNSGVYRTANAGASWTKMSNGLQIPSAFFEGGEIYAAANYEGFYHSPDNGTTWTEWSPGINEQYPSNILMINNQRLLITSGGNIPSYVSLDKGTSWSRTTPTLSKIFPMPDGSYLASSYSTTGGSGVVKSTDGGATWSTFTTGLVMTDVSTADGNTLYGVAGNSIYTKTSSSTWTQLTVTGLPASYNQLKTIAVDSDNKAYIILNNSANNNKPELYQIAFGSAYKMDFTSNPVSVQFYKGKMYAFDGGGTVYSTTDGVTWTSKPTPAGNKFGIGHLDYFFILDNGGAAWLSRDLGSSWQNVGESMGYNQKFADVFFNPNDGVVYGAVQNDYQRKSSIILPAETQAPVTTQLLPTNGAIDLIPNTINLQITFSEVVNPVAGKKIKIVDAASPGAPLGTMDVTLGNVNGNTFTFSPASFTPPVTLAFSKTYFVTIDPVVTGVGAFADVNALPNYFAGIQNTTGPNAWRFSTLLNDGQAPVIATKSPADNAIDVAYNSTIQLTFDENIYAGSAKTVRLYESPSTLVQSFASTQGVITGGKTVTFTPTNPLGNGKSYYVLMDAGAFTDIFGNNSAAVSATTDWNFNTIYVDTQAPVVSTFSPVNNATGVSFSPAPSLQLTFNEDVQTATGKTLRIYDSSAPSTPIETINALTGTITNGKTVSYSISAPLSGSKTYYVLVDAGAMKDLAGNLFAGISTNTVWKFSTVTVDTQPPGLTQLAPTNNATNVAIGTTLALTFDEDIKANAGKKIKLFESTDAVNPVENIDVSAGTINAKSITFTLTKSLAGSKQYYVLLESGAITDMAGNAYAGISANTTWKFSTDAVAPSVTQLTPANNSTDIAFNTTLTLGFSEPILAVSGKTINLFVSNATTPVASLDAAAGVISGNTVTFTLANPLVSTTAYYVLIASGAFTDNSGNPFAGITSATDWTFTTRDGLPPVITLLEPADASSEVSLTTSLKVTFDEAITKVIGKKLLVYESSQTANPIKSIDISTSTLTGKTLTFNPGNIFNYNKSYFVQLETGAVTDANGNQFAGITTNTQWRFSAETDTQKPTITYTEGGPFVKGSSTYLIAASVTDNKVLNSTKVFYRVISSESTAVFSSDDLKFNAASSKYEFSVPESAFDKYGIEFYIEAADAAGNTTRNPSDATAFNYAYVKFSASSAPQLSGLAFGGTLASYRIIAVPYNLEDKKVTTIFGELGSVNKSKWRLLTYFSDTKWNDYPADFTTIDQGVGYWINVKDPTEIFIEGASTDGVNKTKLFTKTFNPGWNQIGNPYPVAISWNAIKSAAPSLGVVKVYKDGFTNGDVLQPMEGGFVFNSGTTPVIVSFPLTGSTGGRQNAENETTLDGANWRLDINMKQDEVTYQLAGVGMHPNALLGFDRFDDVNPPHFAEFAEINFSHPQESIKKFSRDVVPTQDSFTWQFDVDSNLPGLSELYWDNSGFGNNAKEIYLYDVALEKPIDMRSQNNYAFDPKTSSHFKIVYGDNLNRELKPEQISLGAAYPNPAKTQTTIPFNLSENGSTYSVSVEIFDALGKKVGTLIQGNFGSGFYNATWDLQANPSAQGMYLVRLTAKSAKGVEVRSAKLMIEK